MEGSSFEQQQVKLYRNENEGMGGGELERGGGWGLFQAAGGGAEAWGA